MNLFVWLLEVLHEDGHHHVDQHELGHQHEHNKEHGRRDEVNAAVAKQARHSNMIFFRFFLQ